MIEERAPELPTVAPGERFLRLPEVLAMVGLRQSAWYGYIRAGYAPAAIKVGVANFWLESECRQWMAQRIADSRRVA